MTDTKEFKPRNHYREIIILLDELCVELGFCIPSRDADRIASDALLTADQFACEVLLAEGMSPEIETKWRRQLKRRFTDRFGAGPLGELP